MEKKQMRKRLKLKNLTLGVILLGTLFSLISKPFISALAAEKITETDFLKADGKVIKNQKGEEIVLRGTNIGGWLVQEGWMTPTNAPYQKETLGVLTQRFGEEVKDQLIAVYEDNYLTEKDLDLVGEMGMTVLRLPFTYMNLLDSKGQLKVQAWDRLDWLIENCGKRGIYVILDMHGAQGSQNGHDHSGDASDGSRFFEDEAYITNTIYLWEEIAKHYGGNATVAAYDILNEPGGDQNKTTKKQWDVFDQIYKGIRAVDPEHMIMMESCWEPINLPDPTVYGWENVVYQYHNYCWNADNDFKKQKAFVDQKVAAIGRADYNVPTYIGEFTAFVNLEAWQYTLAKYNEAGYSWTTWTYKVTGNSSWGIMNQNVPKVDIYKDSAEEIIEKWSRSGESKVNTKYHNVIKDYLAGDITLPTIALPKAPIEISTEAVPMTDEEIEGPKTAPTKGYFILFAIVSAFLALVVFIKRRNK